MIDLAAMKTPRPPLRDGLPAPTRGPRAPAPSLARYSSAVLAELARKTRYVDPEIIALWPKLAGPDLSKLCRPGRLTGGREGRTLEVVVPHGAAAASVEFAADDLRRRLNDYFGPNAIARIAIIQAPRAQGGPKGGLSRFRTG
jgi:hypothetical protein